MLYNEVENDGGNDCGLYLDEEISSSSSDGEDQPQPQQAETVKKVNSTYIILLRSFLVIFHIFPVHKEENDEHESVQQSGSNL
jgi:hypothetical protein